MDKTQVVLMAAPQLPCPQASKGSSHYWGTWEELLLASAVKRHGTDQWVLVSAELQARTRPHSASPACFTPEACRSEYYALKGRYGREEHREGDLSNDMPWFEELRKLRVIQLKREVEHYDGSIGSLESKLKRLKSERAKTLQNGSNQYGERQIDSFANGRKADAERLVSSSDGLTSQRCYQRSAGVALEGRASGMFSDSSRQTTPDTNQGECQRWVNVLEVTGREKLERDPKIMQISANCSDATLVWGDVPKNVKRGSSDLQDRYGEEDAAISRGVDSLGVGTHGQEEQRGKPVGANASNLVEVLAGKHLHNHSDLSAADGEDSRPRGENAVGKSNLRAENRLKAGRPSTQGASFDHVGDGKVKALDSNIQIGVGVREELPQDDVKAPQPPEDDGYANARDLMTITRGHLLPNAGLSLRTPFSTLDNNQEGSETVSSPRQKQTFALKHKGVADASVLLKVGSGKDMCLLECGTRQRACRVSGDESVPECKHSMEVESADSTEDKQQEVLAVSKNKKSSQAPSYSKDKTRMVMSEAAFNTAPEIRVDRQRLVTTPKRPEREVETVSSTEKAELREVWGESAEVTDSKMDLKQHRVSGLGKRRKLKKSTIEDIALAYKEDIEAINLEKSVETSVKMESMPASHEGIESMQEQGGKEADDYDMGAWHETERLSGDSRVEKSEVSSFVDGDDDMSPTSRRNTREPKVSGKLIPLLGCFRTISSHKCAPLFKRSQESQDDPRYDCLIRAHVDLGMIRARLEDGQYFGSLHFFRDLLLMVNNALVYYPRDSQEFLAATGLRVCIVKEMSNILKTEALLKQEGPSIRKRDPKMGLEVGQSLLGKQWKRKGLKRSHAIDMIARDMAMKLRTQSDVANFDSCEEISGNHHLAIGVKEVIILPEGTADPQNIQMGGTDAERSPQNEPLKGHTISDGWRVGHTNSAAMGIIGVKRELELGTAISATAEDIKERGNLVDSRYPSVNKKGSLVKGVNLSKPLAAVLDKGVESGFLKTHNTLPVPVKRGVGRPPKNSQQQVSQKVKVAEAPNPRRKWVRR